MVTGKANKYLKKYEERNYAPKVGKIEKSDLAKYCNRDQIWKAPEASSSDCIQQSREEQDKILIDLLISSACTPIALNAIDPPPYELTFESIPFWRQQDINESLNAFESLAGVSNDLGPFDPGPFIVEEKKLKKKKVANKKLKK